MVVVDYTEFFRFGHNSEGFGHRRTNSKLEQAVDSAVGSVVDSAVGAGVHRLSHRATRKHCHTIIAHG